MFTCTSTTLKTLNSGFLGLTLLFKLYNNEQLLSMIVFIIASFINKINLFEEIYIITFVITKLVFFLRVYFLIRKS